MLTDCLLRSPLAADTLRLQSCTAHEGLSSLGEMSLSLLSDDPDLSSNQLLGKPITLVAHLRDDVTRELSGYVARFSHQDYEGRYYRYEMSVRPWLWLLTRTTDCRIFQEQSVPDIVKAVFADHPVANFEFKLFRSYRKWTYCVQYRETDFNFVARLLEHEGIYWYFEHASGKHKLVLVDSASAHNAVLGKAVIPFYSATGQMPPDIDYIDHWSSSREVQPGKVVLTDHDFERPSAALEVENTHSRSYDLSDAEVFEYPGGYTQRADGSHYAENRLDEYQSEYEAFHGAVNTVRMSVGSTFKIERHPRADQNAEYLITSTTLHIRHPGQESGQQSALFQSDIAGIAASQQYRPARRMLKSSVQGPQTARVVGPAGEEIFTDKYGRVKVQFHWDRRGKKNEKSSCWIGVSHPWAGKNFGAVHIPRIGQTVIVGFLDGDPDYPIIIGRIYDGEQMPPWDLPANATQSGILTRSSKSGSVANANALRFEDKKGAEQVWLHAEKNQDIEVEHDETHWVGHDRTKSVDNDETVHIQHNRTETVGNDEKIDILQNRTMQIGAHKKEIVLQSKTVNVIGPHTETIGSSMTIAVAQTLTETVGINHAEFVGGAMEVTVGAAMAITVGGAMAETVGGAKIESVGLAKTESVGRNKSVTVANDLNESIGGCLNLTVSKDMGQKIEGSQSVQVTKAASLKAKTVHITADDEIIFKVGSAQIQMKKNGDISIRGNKIAVKGDGDVILKGNNVKSN